MHNRLILVIMVLVLPVQFSAPIVHLVPETKTHKARVTFNVMFYCKWVSDLVSGQSEKIT
jgi:xanthine/uracil/vitamin C permease (AzgA family)